MTNQKQKKNLFAFSIGLDLIKNAKSEEELQAKKSYIIRLFVWTILFVFYVIVVFVPRFNGSFKEEDTMKYFLLVVIPAIIVSTIEVFTYGKPWHDYLRKHR